MKRNRITRWAKGDLWGTIEHTFNGPKLTLDEISQGILAKENNWRLLVDREINKIEEAIRARDNSGG